VGHQDAGSSLAGLLERLWASLSGVSRAFWRRMVPRHDSTHILFCKVLDGKPKNKDGAFDQN
jgi:hypothetical protein